MRIVTELPRPVRTVENLWIPLPDGERLAARLWMPTDVEDRPVPALIEYIPYRKRDLTRSRDVTMHPWLAGHGYATLRIDLRGSGDSDGILRDQYLEQEVADGVEAVEWAARQPWCDGRVGLMGISWGGFNALQIAARQPPSLGAIVTACSTDDTYVDNMHYMGGCLLTDNLSEATTMLAYNSLPPDPELVGERWREMWQRRLRHSGVWLETWLRHQRRDDYWKPGSVCEDYSAIRCPVFAVSGWADGFTNAVFRLLAHLQVPRMGLIGPWSHKWPHQGQPGPAIGFLQEMRRWFDHWLKGIEGGLSREPVLRVWMQDAVAPHPRYATRPGRWVAEWSWPSDRIEALRLPFAEARLLGLGASADGVRHRALSVESPLSVGFFAGKWCSYAAPPDQPGDQREEDGGSLVFDTDPLDRDLEVLGCPEVELEIEADRPVAMVVVRLSDVLPDGKATRVSYGLLNLTHREGNAEPKPVVPGERMRVRVRLNGMAQTFRAGHRVRLSLSSSYWPLAWPPPDSTRITLHTAGSALVLPRRPPQAEDQRLRSFEPPEATPGLEVEQLRSNQATWKVIRDLGTGESALDVVRHDEHYRIPEIDLEIERQTHERYTVVGDDFTSARGETWTDRVLSRGDWRIRVQTRTRLTCNTTTFLLHAEVCAWEGRQQVFREAWTWAIPRDHV